MSRFPSRIPACLLVPFGLMGIGCGADAVEAGPGDESVGTADEALSRSGVYVAQTTATVTYKEIAIGNHSACFIVGLGGGFNKSGYSISVGSNVFSGDLSKRPFTLQVIGPSLTVSAACIDNNSTVMPSYAIDSSTLNNVNLGSASNRICFLDSLRGHFKSGVDFIRIIQSGANWVGIGSTSAEYLSGSATCLTTVTTSEHSAQDFILTPPGGQYVTLDLDLPVDSGSNKGFCGFTMLGGAYNSANDYMSIGQSSASPFWTIRGKSDSQFSQVYGGARCVVSDALL